MISKLTRPKFNIRKRIGLAAVSGLSCMSSLIYAQTTDELLNLLIDKKVITADDASAFKSKLPAKPQDPVKDKIFKIDLEIRPRTEYRNGFRELRRDTTVGAFFTNQRSRINISYEQTNKVKYVLSIQDVRVWGMSDPKALTGNLQVFEAYAEPFITPSFSVKIGRQKLAFDNQRLFAENDWRVNGGSHDAINLRWNTDKLQSQLVGAFNQNAENIWGTGFDQSGFSTATYKSLLVNYTRYRINYNWTLSAINSADGNQNTKDKEKIYQRFTDGGRIEYEKGGFYATVAGYIQSGKDPLGADLHAWYYQPEIKYVIPNVLTVRLGEEVFSGNNGLVKTAVDHSFNPLYGVNHRFNGSMEFFTSKPGDLGNAGLINPYLFIIKNVSEKLEVRADFHTFFSENNYVQSVADSKTKKVTNTTISKYLGAENDWMLSYRPNSSIKLDIGFSYALVKTSLAVIKKKGDADLVPTWWFTQITFKPQIFKSIFN